MQGFQGGQRIRRGLGSSQGLLAQVGLGLPVLHPGGPFQAAAEGQVAQAHAWRLERLPGLTYHVCTMVDQTSGQAEQHGGKQLWAGAHHAVPLCLRGAG
ncbi:hypothetical protein D3C77_597100 [compost metagenome]